MKIKSIVITTIMSFLAKAVIAQSLGFYKDALNASIGIGFPNLHNSFMPTYREMDNFKTSGIGPFHLKIERGFREKLGLGISINYRNTTATFDDNDFGYTYKITKNSIKFNVRANYHFTPNEQFDPYIGLGLGWGSAKTKTITNDDFFGMFDMVNPYPIGLEATIGGRYYILPNIATYLEIGPAKSWIQTGINYKMPFRSE